MTRPALDQGLIRGRPAAATGRLTGLVRRLLMKLDAHDRAQLVMIAYETRLVTPA